VINIKIEAELVTVTDGKPILIMFNNIKFLSQGNQHSESYIFKTSTAMVSCWIRFKNIKDFNLADLREAFPNWNNYSRTNLLDIINPLIKEKRLSQLPDNNFKVINNG